MKPKAKSGKRSRSSESETEEQSVTPKKTKVVHQDSNELATFEKPLCKYGIDCYRDGEAHLAEYAHPAKAPKGRKANPARSIAFPSISTSAYKFDVNIAASVAYGVISKFLKKHTDPSLQLYLVDLTDSETLEVFRKRFNMRTFDYRLKIEAGNLVRLRDQGIECKFIVNASNTTFKGTGSGTNKAIHDACKWKSQNLFRWTTDRHDAPGEPGCSYMVPLPEKCPLRQNQGVERVIHTIGPNMCSSRPNCLRGDYVEGERLMRKAYKSFFARIFN